MTEIVGSNVVLRLVATALSLSLAAWAVSEIVAINKIGVVHALATAIESGGEPRLEVLDQLDEDGLSDRILSKCDTANLRALATVRLKELDLSFVVADPLRADRAYEAAEAAIRKSLSCAPLDGRFWLRMAILDTARRGPSSTTFEYVRLSHWTAPSEGWIVRARVEFAARLFGAGLKEVEPELRSDIRTLVSYDSARNLADMYLAAPESVRPIYREWIELVPEAQKHIVTRAVERRGGNLNEN